MGTDTTAGQSQHELLGFSLGKVKGGGALLRLHTGADSHVDVRASGGILRSLSDTLFALTTPKPRGNAGVPPADEGRPDPRPSLLHGAGRAMSARETRALPVYRRVVAAVNAGATWKAAAESEGADPYEVFAWFHNSALRSARANATASEQRAPILKPSGVTL